MGDEYGEPAGGTSVLEKTDTRQQADDGDADRFAHLVRRDRLDRAAQSGRPVIALCGKVWVPTRDASKYPKCPRCQELYKDYMKFFKGGM